PRIVFSRVYDRTRAFIVRAGTLILATNVLLWGAGYFPGDHSRVFAIQRQIEELEGRADATSQGELAQLVDEHNQLRGALLEQNKVRGELLEQSYLGRFGKAIEPAVRPLGWDWRIGVGVVASFPAREVIVGTLGTIYSLGGDIEAEHEGLTAAVRSATWPDGRKVFSVPVALSIMVFFALCAQCASTLAIIKRETDS